MKSINLSFNTTSVETLADTSVTRNKTNFATRKEHENKFVTFFRLDLHVGAQWLFSLCFVILQFIPRLKRSIDFSNAN